MAMTSHEAILWQLLISLMGFAGLAALYLGYIVSQREHPVAGDLGKFTVLVGFWAWAHAGALLSPSAAVSQLLWEYAVPIFTFVWIPYWVLFGVRYVGYEVLTDVRRRAVLFVPVALLAVGVFSPFSTPLVFQEVAYAEWNGLFVREFQPGTLHSAVNAYRYAGASLTVVLMGRFLLQSRNIYRRQTALVMSIPLIGMTGGVLFQVGLTPHPGIEFSPLLTVVQTPLLALVLFKYDFLNLKPIAPNLAIEEMVDPVVVVNESAELVDFNPAARETFGFGTDSYGVAVEGLVDAASETFSLGDIAGDGSQALRFDGGAETVFDSKTAQITDQYGRVQGQVLVFRNITELKEREQRLERQNEQLDKFASLVSHDLRSPLSVAAGNLALARETGHEERFEKATQALDRMDQIIDDLLTIARSEEMVESPTPVAVAEIAEESWTTAGTPDRDIRIEMSTEWQVEADASLLRTIFENLFRNAVDHNDSQVSVAVGTLAGPTEGFYVEDDGVGIPEDRRDSVFEYGTSTGSGGAGLGLTIVAELVEAHGWHIDVTESASGGTRFEIVTQK